MPSLFPVNTFHLADEKKRLIYLSFLPFVVLISILLANELQGCGDARCSILKFGAGVFSLLFCVLFFAPRTLQIIELLAFCFGVISFTAIVQITVYDVVTSSSDPRLLSDATNGFSMWMIALLGIAYFTLHPAQIMILIRFVTISMLVMAIANFFFIPPEGIETIAYIFRWINSMGIFIALAFIFRGIGIRQKKQAFTDALTGVLNRFALHQILAQEIERSARFHKPFSVAIFDLDHFKNINDTYGHLEGDAVLAALSKLVREHIRTIDYIGRWGGEEFLLIMPETDKDAARHIAERLRGQISDNNFGKVNKITVSFGVTTYELGQSLEETLSRMDNALYQAKEKGRDLVVVL